MKVTFTIKHWWQTKVLFSCEAETLKEAVETAVSGGADLRGADLGGANLRGANLRDANLRDADLRGADLGGADLGGANLRGANLRDADLRGADLRGADLGGANLRGANLRDANLRDADLRGADLRDADLRDADLRDANLGGAKNVRLPTGETWDEYLAETVPALLTAGGKSLESFREHWDCHDWNNCPMAHAFDVHQLEDVPILFRPRAEQFVQLFDAKQILVTVLGVDAAAACEKTAGE